MDPRLFEAARVGNMEELEAMLEDDPILLERMTLLPTTETPLHVATLTEQLDFVKEMMRRKPCFAKEVNKDGLIPLHIACATGNLEIVRELLNPNPEMCLFRDKGGWTSLHFAALRGRVAVVRELLSRCPQSAKEVTFEGDTALHLAVKNSRVDVLKVLLEEIPEEALVTAINAKNEEGQTVSQIAAQTNQVQAMRVVSKATNGIVDNQIHGSLEFGVMGLNLETKSNASSRRTDQATSVNDEPPEEAILRTFTTGLDRMAPVVASVIASTTYSAALSPPKTLWKENMKLDLRCFKHMQFRTSISSYEDVPAVAAACPSFTFMSFISFNTAGFLTAVLIIFLHPNAKIAPLLLSSALVFLTITYVSLTISMSPNLLTFLVIYATSIVAFLCVLFYVTAFKAVFRWFIRYWLIIKKKIHQSHQDGNHARKGIINCC